MNEYAEHFRSRSNKQLLAMIDDPAGYEPKAIDAARAELNKRSLSEDEVRSIRSEMVAEKAIETERQKKSTATVIKVKQYRDRVVEAIDPVRSTDPSPKTSINSIAIAFGAFALYDIIKQFDLMMFILAEENVLEPSALNFFIELLWLPVAIFLFWRERSIGWIMFATFLAYVLFKLFISIWWTWNWEPSGIDVIDTLFPVPDLYLQLVVLAILAPTLWFVCTVRIRDHFGISRMKMLLTLGGALLIGLIIFFR